jgi:3-oxoacyl-[acyl-carrier protein] reductase
VNELSGQVALVTGAGSGIGRATARLFAEEGARVAVVDLAHEGARETAAEIQQAGGDALAIQADVSQSESVADMIQRTLEQWARIDILHNNAGISMNNTPVEEVDEALFDRIIATNVRSVFLGAKYVVPHMKRRGGGVILNTASTAGVRPRMGATAYSASKGAIVALTKALAVELAPFGIRVVSLLPFATDTPMLQTQIALEDPQSALAAPVDLIPLGRLIAPQEVARAALYLVSDAAAMITGTGLEIDGGRLLH